MPPTRIRAKPIRRHFGHVMNGCVRQISPIAVPAWAHPP